MCDYKTKVNELTVSDTMKRYPLITTHIITESLGCSTPTLAARILRDAREGRENYCEWIYSCYNKNPFDAVQDSIRRRHNYTGYMADIRVAKVLVEKSIKDGEEPLLASWF